MLGVSFVLCGGKLSPASGTPEGASRRDWRGHSRTRLYFIWRDMVARCHRETRKEYRHYGGRGIIVCDAWRTNYLRFMEWAISADYNDTLTIERKDVDGNYCPENCCWLTHAEQQRNRRAPKNKRRAGGHG